MKKILFLCAFIGLLAFTSCDDDRFSPIYEVDTPPHTSRLVIRANWTAGSDSLTVFISKSRGVKDKTKPNFGEKVTRFDGTKFITEMNGAYDTVANTKVELLRNGQLLGTIPYFERGYHVAKRLFKLDTVSDVTYTIRISAPNFTTVEASQKTQKRFSILRGSHKTNGAVSQDNLDPFSTPQRGDELSFELQDEGGDENYYALDYFGSFRGNNSLVLISRDTLQKTFDAFAQTQNIDPNMEYNALSDRTFNGKNYVWRFWLQPDLFFSNQTSSFRFSGKAKSGDRITAQIRSLSKEYYLFTKSVDLANGAQDNLFFSEPVILYTNVKNGYGIFTIGSIQRISFVVP